MIGFFRRIRKKLADQNKFLQYSRYAIGEIVLVMVGILLALQVNNWNEERLIKKEHLTMLIKLDNELQTNIDRLNFLIGAHTKIMENNLVLNDILLEGIEKKNVEQFLKSLTFQSNNINLQSSTYEQMKNTGKLYTISSDSLVTAIELYYKFCQREDYYIKKLNEDVDRNTDYSINEGITKASYDFRALGLDFALDNNSWLLNSESKEYIKLIREFNRIERAWNSIQYRINRLIKSSTDLKKLIHEYLENDH